MRTQTDITPGRRDGEADTVTPSPWASPPGSADSAPRIPLWALFCASLPVYFLLVAAFQHLKGGALFLAVLAAAGLLGVLVEAILFVCSRVSKA